MKRNDILRSLAPSCVDFPQTATVWSGQSVQNSIKGKDSHRRSSLRPALKGSPALGSKTHRDLHKLPGTPPSAPGWSEKVSQLPSCCHLWITHLWFPSLAAASQVVSFPGFLCALLIESACLCPARRRCQLSQRDLLDNCPRVALQWLSLLDVHD